MPKKWLLNLFLYTGSLLTPKAVLDTLTPLSIMPGWRRVSRSHSVSRDVTSSGACSVTSPPLAIKLLSSSEVYSGMAQAVMRPLASPRIRYIPTWKGYSPVALGDRKIAQQGSQESGWNWGKIALGQFRFTTITTQDVASNYQTLNHQIKWKQLPFDSELFQFHLRITLFSYTAKHAYFNANSQIESTKLYFLAANSKNKFWARIRGAVVAEKKKLRKVRSAQCSTWENGNTPNFRLHEQTFHTLQVESNLKQTQIENRIFGRMLSRTRIGWGNVIATNGYALRHPGCSR